MLARSIQMETKGFPVFNVRDSEAVPDGKTLCTPAIQGMIDRAAAAGGGTVYFPPGTYQSGTLHLRSHVNLHLEAGSTLLGSPNKDHYPQRKSKTESRTNRYNLRSLIFGEGLENISITGRGAIDGNGSFFKDRRHDGERPLNLRIIDCRDVLVENVSIGNSGFWNQHYLLCDGVRVHGVKVWNHATYNVDAIDIDSCRNFVVSDCIFDSDDDAVCLKGTLDHPCQNIQITNCVISSHCNAIKMGTDSSGGFTDISISNCSIVSPRGTKALYGFDRGISGISLEVVDGGRMERVAISNITIEGVEVPLFVRLGARGSGMFPSEAELRAAHSVGAIRDISLSNILISNGGQTGCSIVGIPGHEIENLTLSDVTIRSQGGGQAAWAENKIEEFYDKYPEGTMFGKLPAHGLYCRHAKGLSLTNVRVETDKPDGRPALVFDDVQDSTIDGLLCSGTEGTMPLLTIEGCHDLVFNRCRPNAPAGAFIAAKGNDNSKIAVMGCDLRRVAKVVSTGTNTASTSFELSANLGPAT